MSDAIKLPLTPTERLINEWRERAKEKRVYADQAYEDGQINKQERLYAEGALLDTCANQLQPFATVQSKGHPNESDGLERVSCAPDCITPVQAQPRRLCGTENCEIASPHDKTACRVQAQPQDDTPPSLTAAKYAKALWVEYLADEDASAEQYCARAFDAGWDARKAAEQALTPHGPMPPKHCDFS